MAIIEQNKGIQSAVEKTNNYITSSVLTENVKQAETVASVETDALAQTLPQNQIVSNGVQYDVSERTNQIAAWLQEMTKQEEEMAAKEEEKAAEKALPWEEEKNAFGQTEESVCQLERMLERMREQQKNAKNNQNNAKKVLVYNYRKISSVISGAKTLMQASNALTSANSNLTSIRRKAASGKYDEEDIAIAKNHAMKMVRVARKKVRNVKSEENTEKQNTMTEANKRQDANAAINRKEHQDMEERLRLLKKELEREEKQLKNLHRRKEGWDLMQADMEYLKRKIDLMRNQENRVEANLSTQQAEVSPVALPESVFAASPQSEQAIQTQHEAAAAVAEVSTGTATANVDVMV